MTPAGPRHRLRRSNAVLLGGLALGLLASELAETIFASALPTLVGDLGRADQLSWIMTAYLLASTIVMPVYGRMSDLLGRRRVLLAALVIFLAGSLVGAFAQGLASIVLARTLQGLGGGGMLILVQAVVADLVPLRRRVTVMSGIGAVFAVAAIAGPPIGGWLTEQAGWRALFWLNLPLGLLAMGAVVLLPGDTRSRPVRLDIGGAVALSLGVSAIVVLATGALRSSSLPAQLGPAVQLGLAGIAVAALLVFLRIESRAVDPLIPLQLFRRPDFSLAVGASGLLAVAAFGTVNYLPTYLQLAGGLSPAFAGVIMLSLVGGLALSTVVAAQLVRRTGRHKVLLVTSGVLTGVALLLLAGLPPGAAPILPAGCLFLLGVGIGCAWEVVVVVVQATVTSAQVGTATAVHHLCRELGVCIGTAVVGGVFGGRLQALLAQRFDEAAVLSLTPERFAALPESLRLQVSATYAAALSPTLIMLIPVALLATVGFAALRSAPLPATSRDLPASDDRLAPAAAGRS